MKCKELYRIMIKEKFLIVFLVCFFIKAIGFAGDEYGYSWKSSEETEFYVQYVSSLEGKYEEWKADKIETDYNNPDIKGQHYGAMEEIYNDYQYVLEDTDKHYFISPNGFELFFLKLNIDWILIILIIFLSMQLVSKDFISGVIQVINTSKTGRKKLPFDKVWIMIFTTFIISILIQLLQILIYIFKYGALSMDAPIQSCYFFGNAEKNLTFAQAWAMVVLLRAVGNTIFGMVMFGVASIIKRTAYIFFTGIGIVFLPLYFLNDINNPGAIYRTIFPLGTLNGYAFLAGQTKDIEGAILFSEISFLEISVIYVIQFMIGGALMLIGINRILGNKPNIMKKVRKAVCICVLISLFLVSGCSNSTEKEAVFVADGIYGRANVTDRYIRIDDYNIYDIENKEIFEISESVFDNERILAVGNDCVMVSRTEIAGNNRNEFTIELLDLEDYERHTLIRFGNNMDEDALLGIGDIIDIGKWNDSGKAIANMGINESVVYEDGCIYYAYDNIVVKADCKSGEYYIVYQGTEMINTTISGNRIYYIDGLSKMICYNMTSCKKEEVAENVTRIWVNGYDIYFTKAAGGLYRIDSSLLFMGNEMVEEFISDITPEVFFIKGKTAAFKDGFGNIYIIDMEKSNEEIIVERCKGNLLGLNENILYVLKYDEDGQIMVEEYNLSIID